MFYIIMIIGLAALDQCFKANVEGQDPDTFPRPMENTNGKVTLYRNHNDGFPFGFLKGMPEVVKMVPIVVASAVGGALAWILPRKGHVAEKFSLALILGGALSNLYDRITRNYVIDYFCIQWKQLKKVVFNLGDIFVFVGAFLVVVLELIHSCKEAAVEVNAVRDALAKKGK